MFFCCAIQEMNSRKSQEEMADTLPVNLPRSNVDMQKNAHKLTCSRRKCGKMEKNGYWMEEGKLGAN
jgi:hypothetical protein